MPDLTTTLGVIGAGATVAATLIAAYSAYLSRRATYAALEAVQAAQRARRDQILPRLILDRDFFDLQVQWPHASALNNEPVLTARKDWRGEEITPPTFTLSNHGESPALDLSLIFELEDPNGDVGLSDAWQSLGITSGEEFPEGSPGRPGLYCAGAGAILFRRVVVPVPNCSPGSPRIIEFPYLLTGRIYLRGLQQWERRATEDQIKPLILTINVSCHTVEGERLETQFRLSINPFAAAQVLPARVYTHVAELAMYPQPDLEPEI